MSKIFAVLLVMLSSCVMDYNEGTNWIITNVNCDIEECWYTVKDYNKNGYYRNADLILLVEREKDHYENHCHEDGGSTGFVNVRLAPDQIDFLREKGYFV